MGKKASVRSGGENAYRIVEARKQAALTPVPAEQITKYTNEFLAALEMPKVESPRIEIPPDLTNDEIEDYLEENLYSPICGSGGNCEDWVWMKFTNQGFLGVVATSNDINFDIPKDEENHFCKRTTSGIIIHKLKQSWDRSFLLAFPLKSIPEDLKRGHIETGIGKLPDRQKCPDIGLFLSQILNPRRDRQLARQWFSPK